MSKKTKSRRLRRAEKTPPARITRDLPTKRGEVRRVLAGAIGSVLGEAQHLDAFSVGGVATITAGVEAAGDKPKRLPTVKIDAYNGGPINVAAYFRPVVIDTAGLEAAPQVALLRNHDHDRIVGHGEATITAGKVSVAGVLSADNDDVQEITGLAKNGFPWQASVGVNPTRVEHVEADGTARVNGQAISGPAVIVRAGKLFEVSILPFGADDTTATSVAAIKGVGDMNFSAWLKAAGFVEAELSDGQGTALRAMYDGQVAPTVPPTVPATPTTAEAAIAEHRAREQRSQAYGRIISGAILAGMGSDEAERMVAAAEEAQATETQFELDVMRAQRDQGQWRPGANNGRPAEVEAVVIEAALARTASLPNLETMYDERTLQRSQDQFPQGMTLMELVVKAARRAGFHSDSHRISRAMLQAAFAPIHARGASTYDLSGVLSNVANKAIRAGFDAVESSWREVSAIGTVTDFKEITRYSLTGDFEYQEVGPGGELKHASMGEQAYGNKADTYGRIFAITRTDFINDDLSAFDRVRNLIGRGGALKLNKVFWTEFLDAVSTFFTTGRLNYFTGASSALDIDSLTTAETMFSDQTDPDGNPMGIDGAILLTPNALGVTATKLANDTEIRVDGSSSKTTYTTGNPHAGKFRPVKSSYLNNANIPNGSALHWFLLANPMDVPMVETVFLNGQQTPTVEAADADFDTLGVQMRGYHDFGARKQEYRGAVRSKGAA